MNENCYSFLRRDDVMYVKTLLCTHPPDIYPSEPFLWLLGIYDWRILNIHGLPPLLACRLSLRFVNEEASLVERYISSILVNLMLRSEHQTYQTMQV